MDTIFAQFASDDGVVVPENECIVIRLVLQNAKLGVNVFLHIVMVAVEMVWGDVHQHGNVSPEIIHVIELERAELNNIVIVIFRGHL